MTVQPTRDQLRALADKATPGPWVAHPSGKYVWTEDLGGIIQNWSEDANAVADMEFIAAARTALPQLLDQLDQAEADRGWNLRSSRIAKKERIEANARAERAEQRARDLTQEVREERGAARDQMEQVRIRDERIKAVRDALDNPIHLADWDDPLVPTETIRRALEGDA